MSDKFFYDFAIIGFQKCGTTSIYQALKNHPEVHLNRYKEDISFFFDKHNINTKRKKNLKGIVNPKLISYPSLLLKLIEHNPKIKIICLIRNPFDRLKSALNMYYQKNLITNYLLKKVEIKPPESFEYLKKNFRLDEINDFDLEFSLQPAWSFYGKQLAYVDSKHKLVINRNLLILTLSELNNNGMKKLYNFLNITKYTEIKKINSSDTSYLNKLTYMFLRFCVFICKNKLGRLVYNKLNDDFKLLISEFFSFNAKRQSAKFNLKISSKYKNQVIKDLKKSKFIDHNKII